MGDPALSLAQISLKVKRATLRPLDSDAARGTRTRRPCSVVTVNGARSAPMVNLSNCASKAARPPLWSL